MPEGQVDVFLVALYQLMCTQQQGITSMVVAQARVPVHLGVHSWAAQASMTWLFTQVILGLGSLSGLSPANTTASIDAQTPQLAVPTEQVEYVAILPDGSTMVKTSLYPGKQVRRDRSAAQPIYLGNDTDSGISCIDQSTPVKALGGKHQPLASTPKQKPKLLVTVQQHRNELVAMRQGALHGAHVWPLQHRASRAHPWGMDLFGWKPTGNPGTSRNSSFVSVEEHAEFTTATLTQRDAPGWPISDNDDIVSVHDDQQSDEEMVSIVDCPEQHTEDSSTDSTAEGSDHPSDSEMESEYDRESHHRLDPGSNQSSKSDNSPGSDSSSGDGNGGDFMDMFKGKPKHSDTPKKPGLWKHSKVPERPESRPSSSNWSRS